MSAWILSDDKRYQLQGLLDLYEEVCYQGHEKALVAWAMDELKACLSTCEDMMDTTGVLYEDYAKYSNTRQRIELAFASRGHPSKVCSVFHVWSRLDLHDDPREVFAKKLLSFLDPVTQLGWLTKVNLQCHDDSQVSRSSSPTP